MYGIGILKGLSVTIKHFVNTYVDDLRYFGRKLTKEGEFQNRQSLKARGMYTVQYPDEKIAVPERFRFIPFLVTEEPDHPERPGEDWCTSCGICAKVCPPQCIWIVRGEDPVTKRPIPQPEAFFIDIDICMNCGFCAEYCPFDAIKMDHDYEMASYDRTGNHIFDKKQLSKPFSYWQTIAPTTVQEEAIARGAWEHTDVMKELKKAGRTPTPPTETYADALAHSAEFAGVTGTNGRAAQAATAVATAEPKVDAKAEAERAMLQLKRAEALARRRAKDGKA
jgi:NADH-quinone oxidoreductase subunit I